ncbi:hypothetical protein AK830_g11308 [Neonectria ditissima]|uniref:PD-(D/E)XK nuclease-like domain-containing protein n=1 Tax=Neonectria ditissima TaxID=78410 RepID=A0A0P7ADB7_9HYPO|nr:hypothetical protein AK830_g11308 [Neonectria ditissima]
MGPDFFTKMLDVIGIEAWLDNCLRLTSIAHETRRVKRKAERQQPSPPESDEMEHHTPKKRRMADPNRTPRATINVPSSSASSASAASLPASDHSDAHSRSSSPKKQMMSLRLDNGGLVCRQLNTDDPPLVAADMVAAFSEIDNSIRILPENRKPEIMRILTEQQLNARLWGSAFTLSGDLDSLPGRVPSWDEVARVRDFAIQCYDNRHEEASWNVEVHHRLLESIFRGPTSCQGHPVDFMTCTSARPYRKYLPYSSSSKMVDLCLYDNTNADSEALQALAQHTPTLSVNHTDFPPIQLRPIVLSIETKRPGKELDMAQLQMGVWHAAQWKFLRSIVAKTAPVERETLVDEAMSELGYIPGIIIQGHRWLFVFSTMESKTTTTENPHAKTLNKTVLWTEQEFGSTQSIIKVYQIVAGLRELARWARDVYMPWYRRRILSAFANDQQGT